MELFLGLGILTLVLAILVSPALASLVHQGQVLAAVAAALAAWLVPVVNLYRYREAPGGCLALVLGFAAYLGCLALGQPVLTCVLGLATPNVGFALAQPALRRLRERRALAQIEAAAGTQALLPWLADPAEGVRGRAVERLSARPQAEVLAALRPLLTRPEASAQHAGGWATVDRLAASDELRAWLESLLAQADDACAALAARRLGAKHGDAALERADDPRPGVRLGLGAGLLAGSEAGRELACRLLVGVLAAAETPDPLRQEALDALEPAHDAPALGEASRAAAPDEPTPELLWLWAEHGEPAQAALAARHVAAESYALANAALEAVSGIWNRTPDFGEHAEPVCGSLRAGSDAIRAVHPPGDNRLADGLIEALDELTAAVATPPPASGDAAA